MNKERLYDIIKNERETVALLEKALERYKKVEDEDLKEIIKSAIKQSFLEYFILIENFTSITLKELKIYKISDDMEKGLKKLYENKILTEEQLLFLNKYRRYRSRIAHVYKQPSVEEIISFFEENREKVIGIIDIMVKMYREN
ncbi:MAG: hypothetical protein ACRC28_08070 [Clostridium sp.]|uniref:hypothetical protein n=1 Tax=Clostridium sp. TaxID=1506 RepID=UPI003F371825